MPCFSPLKGFRNKETGGIVFKRSAIAGEAMEVACGQCLGCRKDRVRMWAIRMAHEAKMHDENCFITLTYDDAHLTRLWPEPLAPATLVKDDFVKFMKRLRKRIAPRKIKYFMCGEYGENYQRPHYHACIFGFEPHDQVLLSEGSDYKVYTSDMLSKAWGLGFVTVGPVTFDTAAYTCGYTLKKITGHQAKEHYERIDYDTGAVYQLVPEYATMSRRPGIGRKWYEKFQTDVFPSDEVPVANQGVFKKVPRYYEEIYKSEDPLAFEEVQRIRALFREKHGHDYTPERLQAKYKVAKKQQDVQRERKHMKEIAR